jgi:branched-chain amino acid transport system permease protein
VDILFSGVEADIDYVGFATFHKAFAKVGIPYLLNPPQLPDFAALGQRGLLFTSPIALAVVVLGMYLLLTKSRFGIAMRAAIENPDLARTVGINVEQVYTVSWFIAGGLAGAAGALYTMWSGAAPSLGIQNVMILDIFAGSVLGGLTNIYGAVLGGTIVAVSENYLLGLMSSSLGSSALVLENGGISMIALIITLLVAHNGLVGVDWRRLYGRAVGRST